MQLATLDLGRVGECGQPGKKIVVGIELGPANSLDEHLQVVQPAERILGALQKCHGVDRVLTSRFMRHFERVAKLLQRDPYAVQRVCGVQGTGFVECGLEANGTPRRPRVDGGQPDIGASRSRKARGGFAFAQFPLDPCQRARQAFTVARTQVAGQPLTGTPRLVDNRPLEAVNGGIVVPLAPELVEDLRLNVSLAELPQAARHLPELLADPALDVVVNFQNGDELTQAP